MELEGRCAFYGSHKKKDVKVKLPEGCPNCDGYDKNKMCYITQEQVTNSFLAGTLHRMIQIDEFDYKK